MSRMIYFCGRRLDHLAASNTDPVMIRGYDDAGNLLTAIRYGVIPELYHLTTTENGEQYRRIYFNATTGDGTATLAYTKITQSSFDTGQATGNPITYPVAVVGDSAGYIYTLSTWVGVASSFYGSVYNGAAAENVYVGGLRKYHRNGERYPLPEIAGGTCLALDTDGSLYIGSSELGTARLVLRKYNSAGSLLWSVAASSPAGQVTTIHAIALDGAGYLYAVGDRNSNYYGFLRKYNTTTGAEVWSKDNYNTTTPYSATCIAITDTGRIYTAGRYMPLVEWDSSGNRLAQSGSSDEVLPESSLHESLVFSNNQLHAFTPYHPNTNPLNAIIYTLALAVDSSRTLIPFASFTTLEVGTLYSPMAVGDTGGNIYLAGPRFLVEAGRSTTGGVSLYGGFNFHAYNSALAQIWTGKGATGAPGVTSINEAWPNQTVLETDGLGGTTTLDAVYATLDYLDYRGQPAGPDYIGTVADLTYRDYWICNGVTVVENVQIPPLKLELRFAIPTMTGDRASFPPGLRLPLSLSAPTWIREFVAAFQPQTIYRAYLTATPQNLPLPLSSFSCRRSLDGGISLTLISPGASLDLVDAVFALVSSELVILRGLRFSSGAEQLDELVRAPYAGMRYDAGANSAALTVTAEGADATSHGYTRPLRGLSYRNQDGQALRVRGEVDTWLRPGDFVTLGESETLLVTNITYQVDANSAVMEIAASTL